MIFAYIRVSTKQQKIDRQYEEIKALGVDDKHIYIDKEFNEEICTLDKICEIIESKLKFPMFIKPSNSGSSVGINKAKNINELKEYIEYASNFDNKILIEGDNK